MLLTPVCESEVCLRDSNHAFLHHKQAHMYLLGLHSNLATLIIFPPEQRQLLSEAQSRACHRCSATNTTIALSYAAGRRLRQSSSPAAQSPYVQAQIAMLTTGAAAVYLQQLLVACINTTLVDTLQNAGVAVRSIAFSSLDVQQVRLFSYQPSYASAHKMRTCQCHHLIKSVVA